MNHELRNSAAFAVVDDLRTLQREVLDHPRRYAFAPEATLHRIIVSIEQREFPSLADLEALVAWVCDVDPDADADVRAAALRVSDALHGKRVEYRPRPMSSDRPLTTRYD